MINQHQDIDLLSQRLYALESQTPTRPEDSLQNVVADGMPDGAMCLVLHRTFGGDAALFYLDKASTDPSDGYYAIATASGVGRWVMLSCCAEFIRGGEQ